MSGTKAPLTRTDIWIVVLIRSRGRVNYVDFTPSSPLVVESREALGGGDLSISRILVAAAERPTVI